MGHLAAERLARLMIDPGVLSRPDPAQARLIGSRGRANDRVTPGSAADVTAMAW
jgi:hypothetical protein